MSFFKKPFEFIARHPVWTAAILFLLFVLPTLALVVQGALEVFRSWAEKLLGDAGRKLADWTEQILSKSFWLVGLLIFFIPPLWPLALLLAGWQAVDYVSGKGGERADFSAVFNRAGQEEPGVGDDQFNDELPDSFDF